MSIFRKIGELFGVRSRSDTQTEGAKTAETKTAKPVRELVYIREECREEFYKLYDKMHASDKFLPKYKLWQLILDSITVADGKYNATINLDDFTRPAVWVTRTGDCDPAVSSPDLVTQETNQRILSSPDEKSVDQVAFEAKHNIPSAQTFAWLSGDCNIARASDGECPDDFDPQELGVLALHIKEQEITVQSLADPQLQYGLFPMQTAQVKRTRLHRVTITGADDSTSIPWLLSTSNKYPFVEWGILVSRSSVGSYRFPSIRWIDDLQLAIKQSAVSPQLSLHICGKYVRDICRGDWTSLEADLLKYLEMVDRIQLNFHSYTHLWENEAKEALSQKAEQYAWQVILQADGVNDPLIAEIQQNGNVDAVPLFDTSGGAGVLPDKWPTSTLGFCGYAGGLGPDNVLAQLDQIADQAHNADIWIDMERNVRSHDDLILDANKVESVLAQIMTSPYLVTM